MINFGGSPGVSAGSGLTHLIVVSALPSLQRTSLTSRRRIAGTLTMAHRRPTARHLSGLVRRLRQMSPLKERSAVSCLRMGMNPHATWLRRMNPAFKQLKAIAAQPIRLISESPLKAPFMGHSSLALAFMPGVLYGPGIHVLIAPRSASRDQPVSVFPAHSPSVNGPGRSCTIVLGTLPLTVSSDT